MTDFQHLDLTHKRFLACTVLICQVAASALSKKTNRSVEEIGEILEQSGWKLVNGKTVVDLDDFMKELDEEASKMP